MAPPCSNNDVDKLDRTNFSQKKSFSMGASFDHSLAMNNRNICSLQLIALILTELPLEHDIVSTEDNEIVLMSQGKVCASNSGRDLAQALLASGNLTMIQAWIWNVITKLLYCGCGHSG